MKDDPKDMNHDDLVDEFAAEVDGETRRISSDAPSRADELRTEILRRLESSI